MSQSKSSNTDIQPIRLNKFLAEAGVSSRRGSDQLISEGRISVNGLPVTEQGLKVRPGLDTVTLDGKTVTCVPSHNQEFTYLLCHKPIQVVSTARDPQGRRTVLDLVPEQWQKRRLYPVGRLDFFSEGLLLLTNDGELTLRLTHPRYHLPKVYHVRVRENPSSDQLDIMRQGMTLAEGEKLAPVAIRRLPGHDTVLEMTLHQGVNRQIRRMCRDSNLTILSLRRLAQGPLALGDLPVGEVRELTRTEVKDLRRAVGLER